MISFDEVDAAARANVITGDQAAALKIFVADRKRVKVIDVDEPFKFLSGFRDFFIAVGLLLMVAAFIAVAAFTDNGVLASALGAAAAWGMAELVAKRDRLALSSIIVSLGFISAAGLFAGFSLDADWLGANGLSGFASQRGSGQDWRNPALVGALVSVAAAGLFYVRFKVPFVLAGLAAATILFFVIVINSIAPEWAESNARLILGISGLVTFLAAMRFDASDPARITRRADCGFWLHLIAAPLIVHSLIGITGASDLSVQTEEALAVFILVAMITLVALVIDRRSMIVSALIYTAAATFATVSAFEGDSDLPIVITLFALATLVIGLGLLWPLLRRMVMIPFEGTKLAQMVPPWRTQFTTGPNE